MHRAEFELNALAKRSGPEPAKALPWLVDQLATLWLRETGEPVTSNPQGRDGYDGAPHSAGGVFIADIVEILQPTAEWVQNQNPEHPDVADRARPKNLRAKVQTALARQTRHRSTSESAAKESAAVTI